MAIKKTDLEAMAAKRSARLQTQAGGIVDANSEFQHSFEVEINQVAPAAGGQTRKIFDEGALRDLAESIRVQGQLMPIVVREGNDGQWIIVAGERRWRACKMLGKDKILCVRLRPGANARAVQLVENLQRSDISALEQARGIKDLLESEGLEQGEVGEALSMSKTLVSQTLSLLVNLAPAVIDELDVGGTRVPASVLYELSRLPIDEQLALWPTIKDGSLKRNALRQLRQGNGNLPPADSNRPTAPVFRGYGTFRKSLDGFKTGVVGLDNEQRRQLAELRDELNELLG